VATFLTGERENTQWPLKRGCFRAIRKRRGVRVQGGGGGELRVCCCLALGKGRDLGKFIFQRCGQRCIQLFVQRRSLAEKLSVLKRTGRGGSLADYVNRGSGTGLRFWGAVLRLEGNGGNAYCFTNRKCAGGLPKTNPYIRLPKGTSCFLLGRPAGARLQCFSGPEARGGIGFHRSPICMGLKRLHRFLLKKDREEKGDLVLLPLASLGGGEGDSQKKPATANLWERTGYRGLLLTTRKEADPQKRENSPPSRAAGRGGKKETLGTKLRQAR